MFILEFKVNYLKHPAHDIVVKALTRYAEGCEFVSRIMQKKNFQ